MKKLHYYLLTAILAAGIGLFAGCKHGDDGDYDYRHKDTRSFTTLENNTLHIIRTQKEYDEFAKNSGDSLPPQVNFSKYSLLVVKVTAPYSVESICTDLSMVEAGKYLFTVDIELNDATVTRRLVITSLASVLESHDVVELVLNMSRTSGDREKPDSVSQD